MEQEFDPNNDFIAYAQNIFNNIRNPNFFVESEELKYAPSFEDLEKTYPIPDSYKNQDSGQAQGFDEAGAKQKIQQLEAGEFLCQQIPPGYTDDVEASKDNQLFAWINEQKFTPSYNSPFEDIKSERILHVEKEGRSDTFKSINDAIEASLPGDVIMIGKGVYEESVVITKPIELKSESDAIIESSRSDAIILNTSVARIHGLTIRCEAPGDTYCLKVLTGFLEVTNCNIQAHCSASFRTDQNTKILAQSCKVQSMNKHTSLANDSRSVFANCEFSLIQSSDEREKKETQSESSAKLLIGDYATGIFVDCKYFKTIITFQSYSQGMVKGSTLERLPVAITVLEYAQILILECTFQNFVDSCIALSPSSYAIIQKCEFSNNNSANISAQNAINFIITDSRFYNKCIVGVRMFENAQGTITNTTFEDIDTAIQVESRCSITIGHCKFLRCEKPAINAYHDVVDSFSLIKVYSCEFTGNRCGCAFLRGIHSNISNCVFSSTQIDFKIGSSGSEATDENNLKIQSIVVINDSEFGVITTNSRDAKEMSTVNASIMVSNDAVLSLTGCTFSSKYKNTITCGDSSICNLTRCTVSSLQCSMRVQNNSKAVIEKSVVGYTASLQSNRVARCSKCIEILDNAQVSLDNSELQSASCAITMQNSCSLTAKNKTKISKAQMGIYAQDKSIIQLDDTSFEDIMSTSLKGSSSEERDQSVSICLKGNRETKECPNLYVARCDFNHPGQNAIKAEWIFGDSIQILESTFRIGTTANKRLNSYISLTFIEGALIDKCKLLNGDNSIEITTCGNSQEQKCVTITGCEFSMMKRAGIFVTESLVNIYGNNFNEMVNCVIAKSSMGYICQCNFSKIKSKDLEIDQNSQFQIMGNKNF
ncbi:hypothetical protein TVAG_313880 [Trichomonas vaginalis G3]|uniref:Right handed beta helix domain-containing protein n=1 Tax=Trichomonas vaginalis (strain ATCC PRA-98 / G3) TaxID=412133 RepID=A2EKI6_TRIV3|nr:pectin lyase-like family [Trichomonas vaginalis G3]EAY06813.1 hypothetical protein TVAG_313880 [Trichomonas vaginalis G3]KAI5535424.1 pectin lyase-like family [Trichomonas vaginalis G3]|eukprot:XP_001319036.1 hypothetical protein [Trichomonas vaginalis G3]